MLRIQQIKLTLSESLDQLPDKIIMENLSGESGCSQGEGCAFYILH